MRRLRELLHGVVLAILLLLTAVLFYVLVIMGDAPDAPDIGSAEMSQPAGPLTSLPQASLSFTSAELHQAGYYFSAPILRLAGDTPGWQLESVLVSESVPSGVDCTVREIALRYRAQESGALVTLSSMTPDDCLRALPARGFAAASDQEWSLAGLRAVLMRSGTTLNLSAQRADVVYQIEGDIDMDTLRQLLFAAELAQAQGL